MEDKEFYSEAKKLFVSKLNNYQIEDIVNINLLLGGFTNKCFFIETKDRKRFFLRLGNSKIDRTNESSYLNASKKIKQYIYYDFKTGDAIKRWEEGYTASFDDCLQKTTFIKIIKEIKKIQRIKIRKIPDIKERDFFSFLSFSKLDDKYIQKYKEIINKYKYLEKVLSHNDIRPSNVIINKSKVRLIDFEWCTLNNQYWDLANTSREINFPLDELEKIFKRYFRKLDFNVFKEMLFATSCFAVQWTFFEKESKELLKYRENVIKIMDSYYQLILQ